MIVPASPPSPLTEGERWARQQLELLLSARFAPSAVAGFLVASQRRANEVRRVRPELASQSRLWMGAGAALWAALAAAGVRPFRERARSGLAWWAATAVMLDWHLGMVETADGRPRPLTAADALTLARVWLAPVALEAPSPLVCAAGFATDVLDGQAARSLGEPTRAGRDLEGLADLCFAAAMIVGLRRGEKLGRTAAAAELTRVGAGFSYALFAYFGRAEPPSPRLTRAARLTTPVRAGGLVIAAAGRRRLGTAVMTAGCAASVGLLASALRRPA
ncbi:MAG: CDP-alcohol phosphatidyltransferase family protein [Thermoleophilaceae bacterium]